MLAANVGMSEATATLLKWWDLKDELNFELSFADGWREMPEESAPGSPVTMSPHPSPPPAPTTNPGYIVPRDSSAASSSSSSSSSVSSVRVEAAVLGRAKQQQLL
jgi:hypothetical protein